jgi:hypothetical protein
VEYSLGTISGLKTTVQFLGATTDVHLLNSGAFTIRQAIIRRGMSPAEARRMFSSMRISM